MKREHRVAGTIIGAVVGDALGAPFEFGSPRAFSKKFPSAARGLATEMCGGGSCTWAPGEFTDDTQMALIVGESLLRQGASMELTYSTASNAGLLRIHLMSESRLRPFFVPAYRGTKLRLNISRPGNEPPETDR